jgi:uncharacterized coiled-coil protein SlyX
MFNPINMHSIKHYTTAANKTVTYATVYIMNAYQSYPDIYNFVLRNVDNHASEFIAGCICWMFFILILRGIIRACMDPFSVKLHTRIAELETKLSEEEDMYSILFDEKCEQDVKIAELTEKLKEAEKALADINSQYLSCRQAAKRFLDATQACQANQT